jgi:hypothetical protein
VRFPNTNHVGAMAVLGTKVYNLGDLTAVSDVRSLFFLQMVLID